MALTVREIIKTAVKDRYMHLYKVDFDSSYPSGGEALTTGDLGFSDLASLLTVIAFPQNGFTFKYDGANSKLLAYAPIKSYDVTHDTANATAVASVDETVTVTGLAATDVVIGVQGPAAMTAGTVITGTRTAGANSATMRVTNPSAGAINTASGSYKVHTVGAAGQALEVAASTDLSGLTGVIVMAFGKQPA